jgi:UDP-N-acetylglucosamine 2-epimerase (non-hydrolysing)
VTGDVMYDALLWARDVALRETSIIADLDLERGEYVLVTVHRPRNADDPDRLAAILDALTALPKRVVFPVHPRTADRLDAFDLRSRAERELTLIDPVGYLKFVALTAGARCIVTDSGGVQKEAFFLDTPCVTLRKETEWVETVEAGWNVLVGADTEAIAAAVRDGERPAFKPSPYGDGDAAAAIVDLLESASGV